MDPHFYVIFLTGFIPLIVGFIYYHEKVMGGRWMKVNKFSPEELAGGNMTLILIISYFLGVMLSLGLVGSVIHQSALYSLIMADPLPESEQIYNEVMGTFGHRYLTFGHGAAHGVAMSLLVAFPLIATNALFEKRGWAYIGIHMLYWTICTALMGGFLCLFFY